MDIKVTSCQTGKPLYLAIVSDEYGNSEYTNQYGFVQIVPGTEGEYYGTVVQISAGGYITNEFTLNSYGENDCCLQPAPTTGGGGSSGGGSLY
ncbi:MAG TPA: hypothetical protein VFE63_17330 [Roseiarcus sp.]|jgi:hypothetical protein|nr:hypothetical protein [Roseiarcus sp.]